MLNNFQELRSHQIGLTARRICSAIRVDHVDLVVEENLQTAAYDIIASFKAFWWNEAKVDEFPQAAFTYDTVWAHIKGTWLSRLVAWGLLAPPRITAIRQQFYLCPHLPSQSAHTHLHYMTQGAFGDLLY